MLKYKITNFQKYPLLSFLLSQIEHYRQEADCCALSTQNAIVLRDDL